MERSSEGKAVCFNCRFIEAGASLETAVRCPHCGYPMILNTAPVALAADQLEAIFRMQSDPFGRRGREILPGISARGGRKTRRVPQFKDVKTEPLPKHELAELRKEAEPLPPPPTVKTPPPVLRDVRPRPRVLDARRPQSRRKWLLA